MPVVSNQNEQTMKIKQDKPFRRFTHPFDIYAKISNSKSIRLRKDEKLNWDPLLDLLPSVYIEGVFLCGFREMSLKKCAVNVMSAGRPPLHTSRDGSPVVFRTSL